MNRIRARWWMDTRWQDKLTGSSVSLDDVRTLGAETRADRSCDSCRVGDKWTYLVVFLFPTCLKPGRSQTCMEFGF